MYLSKILSLVGTKDSTDRNVSADGSGDGRYIKSQTSLFED